MVELRVGIFKTVEGLCIDDLPSFLDDSVCALGALLINTPLVVIFDPIFDGLHRKLLLFFRQVPFVSFIEEFAND